MLLGVPHGEDYFNVGKANRRIRELETKLAKPTAAQATPAAHPASPTVPASIEPDTLSALTVHIFGPGAASDYEGQRLAFTRAGLSVPNLAPSPPNPNFTPKFTGINRAVRGARQERVNAFFAKK